MTAKCDGVNVEGAELVFGLVGAVGTDLDAVSDVLASELRRLGYKSELIRLSQLLKETDVWPTPEPDISGLDKYIKVHQETGNEYRKSFKRADALALSSVAAIRKFRESVNNDSKKPVERQAYILRSLKHEDEVTALRKIYGEGFFLIAGYSPRANRVDDLAKNIAASYHEPQNIDKHRSSAEELINIDQSESDTEDFGQNVRDAFPLADVFVDVKNTGVLEESISRFIRLLFSDPFITPSREEYVMYHTKASALRSADLSRQVGAAISSGNGDVIAVGANDIPKVGGGLYWEGDDPDHRDFTLGKDTSNEMKREALAEMLDLLKENKWLSSSNSEISSEELVNAALPILEGTQFMNVGEFGRSVHAEMAALLDAARRGIPVGGSTLFTTTFPCHNCAKHIIAAGVERVVYIEPYPKSLARYLHSDEIAVETHEACGSRVIFEPFVGIAPIRYMDLFTMPKRKKEGKIIDWESTKSEAVPRFPDKASFLSYLQREDEALYALGRKSV